MGGVCSLLKCDWLPRPVLLQVLRCQRPARSDLTPVPAVSCPTRRDVRFANSSRHEAIEVVAREGIAPSTSLCKRDMILFHHRAIVRSICHMAASLGFAPRPTGSKPDMLLLHHEAIELVEPEVVATSPYPGKSRVPVCCGFDSVKMVGERGVDYPSPTRWMPQAGLLAIANRSAPPRLADSPSAGSAIPPEPLARN